MRNPLAAIVVAASLLADSALACTTFCTRGLFGRNYDFEIGHGMVIVNKRGVAKQSSLANAGASWTSRYGSLTFNQFGRDVPTGGVNEKGLVVELMWLDGTQYPKADQRPQVGTLEWIQYQLDNAATVGEVIANARKVRISERGVPLHYLVADRYGATAAIEFLGGELVVHRKANVLANDTYQSSVEHLKRGDSDAAPGSYSRFARASNQLATVTSVDQAFAVLDAVAQRGYTQWSIVYDLKNSRVHYRTQANRDRRSIDLGALDYRCATPVKVVDIDRGAGDVTAQLADYTLAANLALVKKSTAGTSFLKDTPAAEIEESARHPERSRCERPAAATPAG